MGLIKGVMMVAVVYAAITCSMMYTQAPTWLLAGWFVFNGWCMVGAVLAMMEDLRGLPK